MNSRKRALTHDQFGDSYTPTLGAGQWHFAIAFSGLVSWPMKLYVGVTD
jgi:hypothetical protein